MSVRVALAQVAPILGNVDANLRMHRMTATAALRAGAELVIFPELSLTGYLLQDLVPEVALTSRGSPALRELLALSRRIGLVVGLVEESEDHRYYNSVYFLSGGKVLHRHRKVYLPTYGMFDEGREFAAGDSLRAFSTPLGRFGILNCEDAWHPTSAYLLGLDGADYLLIVSSGPSRGIGSGKEPASFEPWRELCQVTARFQTVYVVYVNRVGVEDGMLFAGGSSVVDPQGRIICQAPSLKETILYATLSSAPLRRARTAYPLRRDARPELLMRELARIVRAEEAPDQGNRGKRSIPPTRPVLARGRLG
jgi:predicted amidohydrolase